MFKPDQTRYLAHFTKKDGKSGKRPLECLINILADEKIMASSVYWTNHKAVCFTECPWESLLGHADLYSPYGIGFDKEAIFAKGGNPVMYLRPELFRQIDKHGELGTFINMFLPKYAPESVKKEEILQEKPCIDYTHEREWRVPGSFGFSYKDIKFIVINKVEDLKQFPEDLIQKIGLKKFLFLEAYRKIQTLWPKSINRNSSEQQKK